MAKYVFYSFSVCTFSCLLTIEYIIAPTTLIELLPSLKYDSSKFNNFFGNWNHSHDCKLVPLQIILVPSIFSE